jgi:hypothetical protein
MKKGMLLLNWMVFLSVIPVQVEAQDAESYQWQNVVIRGGGFVPGIVFSPARAGLIFARTDMAGAYRWNEKSYEWTPVTDWIGREDNKYFGIESIALDPQNPDVVYMAAGSYLSSGNGIIMKSTDRGNTWTKHETGVAMGGNHDGRSMGERLAIDPNRTDILYFGSRQDGLLRSLDAGISWQKVENFPVAGIRDLGLTFIFFDKNSGSDGKASSVVYVGVADTIAGSNLYRSNDGGILWDKITGGPSGLMPHHFAMTSDGILYFTYNNGPGPNGISYGEVWKYYPGDDKWQNVSPPATGGGFGGISCHPDNPRFVIVTTIDRWNPTDEIYRSEDAGNTWKTIGSIAQKDIQGVNYLYWDRDTLDKKNISSLGWMGDIDIDPFNPDRVFYVTGQGIWCTENVWDQPENIFWRYENKGLEETVALDMTSSVKGALFSAVGDLGGFRHAPDSLHIPSKSGMYNNPVFGNCDGIDFAALNPDFVVRCGTSRLQNGAYSIDNGRTWSPFEDQAGRGGGKIAIAADGSTIIWSQWGRRRRYNTSSQSDTLVYSRDWGQTWKPCSGVSGHVRITADRVNPDKFYAFDNSTIYLSTDKGEHFIPVKTGIDTEGYFVRIQAVFGHEGDIWIAGGNRLYHSSNSGFDVRQIEHVEKVYAVGFGKAAPETDYPAIYLIGMVDGKYGVFRSTDKANSWIRINDDQHQYGSMDYVAGDELVYGRVYIGTHGRGIIYGDPL